MKFVRLLRPLFLVALGLHGLALFLPIGGAFETAKIGVAEETGLDEDAALTTPENTLGKLPVPDLNVTAGAMPTFTNGITTPVLPAQITSAAQPSAAARRSAPLALAVPNAAAARARPTGGSSIGSLPPVSPVASTIETEAINSSASPLLTLPAVEAANANDRVDSVSANRTSANGNAAENSQTLDRANESESNRGLIASATSQLPDSLKALMNRWAIALTYNPKGTDDSSAKAARSKWLDKINAQASGVGVGPLEPKRIDNFALVKYPIESSVRDREQPFRVCLEQMPSSAEVGVLFDSQGRIVGELELIRSTGYKAINEEVLATVEAAEDFPKDRLSKAFIFEVGVDYDRESCVKLSDLKS